MQSRWFLVDRSPVRVALARIPSNRDDIPYSSIPRSRMLMAEPNKPDRRQRTAAIACFPSSHGKPVVGMDVGATFMRDFKETRWPAWFYLTTAMLDLSQTGHAAGHLTVQTQVPCCVPANYATLQSPGDGRIHSDANCQAPPISRQSKSPHGDCLIR